MNKKKLIRYLIIGLSILFTVIALSNINSQKQVQTLSMHGDWIEIEGVEEPKIRLKEQRPELPTSSPVPTEVPTPIPTPAPTEIPATEPPIPVTELPVIADQGVLSEPMAADSLPDPINLVVIASPDSYDNIPMLWNMVEAEAGNQGMMGKRLVACVALNRVDHPDWPNTITGVITQPGQFTSYSDGGMERHSNISDTTKEAVALELQMRSYPYIYYFNANQYSKYGIPCFQYGAHYFSTK